MTSRFSSLRTGPKLARRLARVDLGALPDEQLLDYLHAQARQLSFQQAELWRAMAEVGRRAPLAFDHGQVWTPQRRFDSAACEIVAELRVSKPYASHELEHAQDLEAMPAVAAALRAGDIDRTRALVLLDVCRDLTDQHRDTLLDQLLPEAGTLPAGTLRANAQRIAIALDPDWAERRYRASVREQKVVCYFAQDGTVMLSGENLPVEEALAAKAHVWALAKAAKRAGAHASSDRLRATLYTGLLSHRFLGLNQAQIIAELVKQFPKPAADQPDEDTDADQPDERTFDEPHAAEPRADEPRADHEEPTDGDLPDDQLVDDDLADHESADGDLADDELTLDDLLDQPWVDDESFDPPRFADEATDPRAGDRRPVAAPVSPQRPASRRGQPFTLALVTSPLRAPMPRSDHDPDPPPF